jgi:hypothetical protein
MASRNMFKVKLHGAWSMKDVGSFSVGITLVSKLDRVAKLLCDVIKPSGASVRLTEDGNLAATVRAGPALNILFSLPHVSVCYSSRIMKTAAWSAIKMCLPLLPRHCKPPWRESQRGARADAAERDMAPRTPTHRAAGDAYHAGLPGSRWNTDIYHRRRKIARTQAGKDS